MNYNSSRKKQTECLRLFRSSYASCLLPASPAEIITTQNVVITIPFFNMSHPSMGASADGVLLSLPLNYSERVLWKLLSFCIWQPFILMHATVAQAHCCIVTWCEWAMWGGGCREGLIHSTVYCYLSRLQFYYCPATATTTLGQTELYILPHPSSHTRWFWSNSKVHTIPSVTCKDPLEGQKVLNSMWSHSPSLFGVGFHFD